MTKLKYGTILDGWSCLSSLDKGINRNENGRYGVYKARKKVKDDAEFLIEEETKLNEKYFNKSDTGQLLNLKDKMKHSDYRKEMKALRDKEMEVEIYKFKYSTVKDALVYKQTQAGIVKEEPFPGEFLEKLEPWIIDDYDDKEEKPKKKKVVKKSK